MALKIKTLTEELKARDKQLALLRNELGMPEDYLSQKTSGVYNRKTLIERIEDMQKTLEFLMDQQLKQQQAKHKT